ncbi:MAG: DUF4870 domain-containing protein [Bacteroidota bacterium]
MDENNSYSNKFEEMSDAIFDDSAMADEFLEEELPEGDIETLSESSLDTQPITPPTQDEKSWFLLAHLSALASFVIPFGSILGPLIVWQAKKEQIPAVVPHAKAALNFQLSMLIYMLISIPLIFIVVGVFTMIALGIISVVFTIMNAIKAQNGQPYKYPFTLNLIK